MAYFENNSVIKSADGIIYVVPLGNENNKADMSNMVSNLKNIIMPGKISLNKQLELYANGDGKQLSQAVLNPVENFEIHNSHKPTGEVLLVYNQNGDEVAEIPISITGKQIAVAPYSFLLDENLEKGKYHLRFAHNENLFDVGELKKLCNKNTVYNGARCELN